MELSGSTKSFTEVYSLRKHKFDWIIFIPFYAVVTASFLSACECSINIMDGPWICDNREPLVFRTYVYLD